MKLTLWDSITETFLFLTFSDYWVFGQKVATAGDRRLDTESSNSWPSQSINLQHVVYVPQKNKYAIINIS